MSITQGEWILIAAGLGLIVSYMIMFGIGLWIGARTLANIVRRCGRCTACQTARKHMPCDYDRGQG